MINIALLTTYDNKLIEPFIQHFSQFENTQISCVISNKENNIDKKLRKYKIKSYITKIYKEIDKILTKHNIHYIILINYLDIIPPKFCQKYKYRLINSHPSLLPKYDDKNIDIVFKQIINNKDKISGISIHFVDYGQPGKIIFQKEFKIGENMNWEKLKTKSFEITKIFYPILIEKIIRSTYKKLFKN